jgi:hypothetical protein
MGYKLKHPIWWLNKYKATADEQEQLSTLLNCSPRWHERANSRLRRLRSHLGYNHANLQRSEEWLNTFQQTLLQDGWWSERRGILKFRKSNPRRFGLALLALYLFAQHARIQFKSSIQTQIRRDAASPHEELAGNHHNLDHSLLLILCSLCGHKDTLGIEPGWFSRRVHRAVLRYLKPVPDVDPNTVMRWARAAEAAAGVVPRGAERLRMTWKTTQASAWKQLQERSWRYFPDGWRRTWRRSKVLFLVLCAIYIYGAYYSVRWVLRLLHF